MILMMCPRTCWLDGGGFYALPIINNKPKGRPKARFDISVCQDTNGMSDLTLLLFVAALGLFLAIYVLKRSEIVWMAFFVSICSFGQSVTDSSLDSFEMGLLAAPMLYIIVMMVVYIGRGKFN